MKDCKDLKTSIDKILDGIANLVPVYLENEEERIKANGNVAVCLIDDEGNIYGKIFGTDKGRGRESFRVAWIKASQVWITGVRTGEFERKVFNKEIMEEEFGIRKPDYIGWEGGQPITIGDGIVLSVGVSGLRGVSDLEIVVKASNNIYQTI